jgi:hypothetical protein
MKIFTWLLLTFLSLNCHVHGQVNRYVHAPIVNYPAGITNGSEQNWAITQDNRGVIYVGNDDKGVLEYDGSEWRNIPIPNKSIITLKKTVSAILRIEQMYCLVFMKMAISTKVIMRRV